MENFCQLRKLNINQNSKTKSFFQLNFAFLGACYWIIQKLNHTALEMNIHTTTCMLLNSEPSLKITPLPLMSLWNPGDPEVPLISKMELFVTTVNRISKSYILNAAGASIYSDSYHPPVATVLPCWQKTLKFTIV